MDACEYVSNIYKWILRRAPSILEEEGKTPFAKQAFSS